MKGRRLWIAIIAGFLALVMILGLLAGLIAPRASAQTVFSQAAYSESTT